MNGSIRFSTEGKAKVPGKFSGEVVEREIQFHGFFLSVIANLSCSDGHAMRIRLVKKSCFEESQSAFKPSNRFFAMAEKALSLLGFIDGGSFL